MTGNSRRLMSCGEPLDATGHDSATFEALVAAAPRVLRRVLWIDTSQVQVHVDAGVVTLTGAVGRQTTAAIAARLAALVPGVVAVMNQIRDTFDDTTLARSRTHRTHPFSAEPFRP